MTAKIFLSHTGRMDRLPTAGHSFVQAAIDAAIRAGYALADMRYFSAADRPPADVCERCVRECSVYVGFFGFDYGTRVRGRSEISYTELEFLTAIEERARRGMRVLVFLLKETKPLPARLRPFNRFQRAFRKRVRNNYGLTICYFKKPEKLELEIFHALMKVPPPPTDVPKQHMPHLLPKFTGRLADLDGAERDMRESLAGGTAPGFVALRGMGGIGKTSLAAALAERLAADGRTFPGGALWADCLDKAPEDVIRDFVRDLGGDPAGMSRERCLTRYHELVALRRPLIVLDNVPASGGDGIAADLLARAPGAATLLTTRFRDGAPSGLPVREVGVFSDDEARDLLRAHVGKEADGPAATAVLERCGNVPLFVDAAGRVVATKRSYSLAEYAEELRRRGLSAFADEDTRAAVVFDLSWQSVGKPAREVFAALALAPGEEVGPNLVSAWLRRGGDRQAVRLLTELFNAALLQPTARARRYRYHDLARDFGRGKLTLPAEVAEVRRRLLECYTDWDVVKAELDAVGASALAGHYRRLAEGGIAGEAVFAAWNDFVGGQAGALAAHPELFFQQALNEPTDSPVSLAAQARAHGPEAPGHWLEWVNRPRDLAAPRASLSASDSSAGGRPRDPALSLAVSADGQVAVWGSEDFTVRVWEVAAGRSRAPLRGHKGWVRAVAVSADGRTAVSGADDTTVRVWDLTTRRCRATLRGHEYGITRVALAEDGRIAVTGSHDGTVRVWDLTTRRCRADYPQNSSEARGAWESVGAAAAFTVRRAGAFLQLWAPGAECPIARFPGQFSVAACSADGRHVIARSLWGEVYVLSRGGG